MTNVEIEDFIGKPVISNKPNYEGFSFLKNSRQNLFWPCVMYQVELQVYKNNLDIFERTILKLADCNITSTKDVADTMNLEEETVLFIQNRLFSKGLLEDKIYLITDEGRDFLNKSLSPQSFDTKVYCLFKNLLTGEFIDMVEENPAKNTLTIIPKKDCIEGKFFLPGDEEKTGYVIIPEDYKKFINVQPKSFELLRAIKKFNRNAREENKIELNSRSNSVNVITDDIVFVHTVGFATNIGDVYSTDASGIGVSDIFTNFIRNADDSKYPWIKKIVNGGKIKIDSDEQNSEKTKTPNFSYPGISNLVNEAKKDLKELKNLESKNQLEREKSKQVCEKIYYNIFTALEYALQMYYSDFNCPSEEDVKIKIANDNFRKNNQNKLNETDSIEENIYYFSELAENLDFNLPEKFSTLLKVYPGKIKAMRKNDEPEIIPLLCLSLAYANFDNNAPMFHLANDEPDFLLDLFELKSWRDKTFMAHGPGLDSSVTTVERCKETIDLAVYYMSFLNEKIKTDFDLINDYFKNEKGTRSFSKFVEQHYEKKVELYNIFGFSNINNLPRILIQQLVTLLMTFDEKKFISGGACSVLQQFFEYAIMAMLKNMSLPEKESRNAKSAEQKCLKAGFNMKNNHLPETLSTVNYKKINKAVCGGGVETLGAGVIAFVLLLSESELEEIAKSQRNFIIDLDFLLKSRGHSDIKEYSLKDVSTYKNIVVYIVKELINFI